MSIELTPVNPEELEKGNRNAIRKIRSMAPDLWVVEEREHRILTGNNDGILCANPAEPGKSRLGERFVRRRRSPLADPPGVVEIARSASGLSFWTPIDMKGVSQALTCGDVESLHRTCRSRGSTRDEGFTK